MLFGAGSRRAHVVVESFHDRKTLKRRHQTAERDS
jgi:hypothetical protein